MKRKIGAAIAATLATASMATACTTAVNAGTATNTAANLGTAATTGSGNGDDQRGSLVSATPLRVLPDRAAVTAELSPDGFDASSARFGVRTYRLVYRTVDAHGRPTEASGLLALPVTGTRRLTVVSFTHGTEINRNGAPSEQPSGFEPAPVYTYASAGFAAAAPDYLGLGTGPGLHPWMDVPSETTAALDMLRAARAFAARGGHFLDRRVLATGFSQGASAALGLGRALLQGADPWFRLGALAPISGAYDLQHVEIPAILDGELTRLAPDPRLGDKYSVVYTAYLFVGLNRVRPIDGMPGKIFKAPYSGTIGQLFDGDHTGDQLFSSTPSTLDDLLTPYGFALLRDPVGGLLAGLRSADSVCANWTPNVPTRLYLATDDEQAVNANTFHCQAAFAAHGARVPVVNLGTPDNQGSRHLGSNAAGTAQIVRWFAQLTSGPVT